MQTVKHCEVTMRLISAISLLLVWLVVSAPLSADSLPAPGSIPTHDDGRKDLGTLYQSYRQLEQQGWVLETVVQSRPEGRDTSLPIIALRTPHNGKAIWILSGIHGEEPAGPNAIAESIDAIARLGKSHAVVLLPLNNPHGYARNWRYLNTPVYSEEIEGQSVGDSSHLLFDPDLPGRARAPVASSPEADALTRYVLDVSEHYPPEISIDLHEDNLIDEGYVYSQGSKGASDPLAALAVRVLRENGIPLKLDGTTRFDEPVSQGIIGPVIDSSIDELISASQVIVEGEIRLGPRANTVLVFETPAAAISFPDRVQAHANLLRVLAARLEPAPGQ